MGWDMVVVYLLDLKTVIMRSNVDLLDKLYKHMVVPFIM